MFTLLFITNIMKLLILIFNSQTAKWRIKVQLTLRREQRGGRDDHKPGVQNLEEGSTLQVRPRHSALALMALHHLPVAPRYSQCRRLRLPFCRHLLQFFVARPVRAADRAGRDSQVRQKYAI